jgi:hypothetical protein
MENGKTWPRPSYRIRAELESSNPPRISKKMGGLASGEDGISPIPCGSGLENGPNSACRMGGPSVCWIDIRVPYKTPTKSLKD